MLHFVFLNKKNNFFTVVCAPIRNFLKRSLLTLMIELQRREMVDTWRERKGIVDGIPEECRREIETLKSTGRSKVF